MIPPMPTLLLALLTIATPVGEADASCGDGCIVQILDLCVYQTSTPPFVEIRPCDEEVQNLKLG